MFCTVDRIKRMARVEDYARETRLSEIKQREGKMQKVAQVGCSIGLVCRLCLSCASVFAIFFARSDQTHHDEDCVVTCVSQTRKEKRKFPKIE